MALLTSMMIAVATAMVLSAGLCVVMAQNKLEWNQANAEAALQLADAGINSELQVIASNTGQVNITLKSSQPVATVGVTLQYPGENYVVKGRKGTLPSYTGGYYYAYSSNDAAGTIAWDGVTSPFYITSSAYVNKAWQRVQVQSQSSSLFNIYGTFALASYPGAPNAVTLAASSNVTVTGPAGINGQVTQGSGSTMTSPQAINANTCTYSSGQFTSSHVASGGVLTKCNNPFIYPTTQTVLKTSLCGHPEYTDSQAWSWLSTHHNNGSCIYQYKSSPSSSTINTSNCQQLSFGGTTLNNSCFASANTNPDTYDWPGYWWWPQTVAVHTLIFEPGDYYFTSMQLNYAANCGMVIDSQAKACGGTAGQVRFWLYDSDPVGHGTTADNCSLKFTHTLASGQSTPDPGLFRIYCGKDNASCSFNRPSNCQDWQGNTVTGDFDYYCGIYASTKQCNGVPASSGSCSTTTDDSTKHGCTVGFTGTTSRSGGCSTLHGSCLTDKMSCQGYVNINYTASATCSKDPCGGAKIVSWCKK